MLMANLATFSIRHTSMDRKHLTDNTKLAPRIRGCRNVHMITGKRIFPLFFFFLFFHCRKHFGKFNASIDIC
jgi:hypothetical protein